MTAATGVRSSCPGIGARERLGLPGIAIEAEKQVVSTLVATDYQEAVLEAVFRSRELKVPDADMA